MEIGFIKTRKPMKVYLLFERFPVWLFVLESSWILELIIVGHTSIETFLVLFTKGEADILTLLLRPFIKVNTLSFCHRHTIDSLDSKEESILLLLSGSLFGYLVPLVVLFQEFKVCGVVDVHFNGRLRNGRPASNDSLVTQLIASFTATTWHRRRHTASGGPTKFVALFVFIRITYKSESSLLQRGIRHFFNASIRSGPEPKILPEPRLGNFYHMDDRLVPGLYHLPVVCPSHFYSSGRGYRSLTSEELGTAHGFPRHLILPNFPAHVLTMPPCQLLMASIQAIWVSLPAQVLMPIPKSCQPSKTTETWIPALRRYMSHLWIDESLITSIASKADDAVTPYRLWDVRLELLFPGCSPKLCIIRNVVLRWMRLRLLREIRRYLSITFGTGWLQQRNMFLQNRSMGHHKGLLGGYFVNFESRFESESRRNSNLKRARKEIRTRQTATEEPMDNKRAKATVLNREPHSECKVLLGQTEPGDTTPVISNLSNKIISIDVPSNLIKRLDKFCNGETETDIDVDRLMLEIDKLREVLDKFCNASWWEWDNGSALFFWRWGEDIALARDGMVPFITDALPRNLKAGRSLGKEVNIEQIVDKLSTIIRRGYIEPGHVTSLIDYFAVPKGEDIRLVYNGTSCGLNGSTWAPNFWLPYPSTAIRLLDYGYYSVDVDFGEMFLNFPLHKSIQSSSGIDLTPFQKELEIGNGNRKVWYCWKRNWMGARMSPYSSVQFGSFAEEFCRENRNEPTNPLRWDAIILNLPGSSTFDPSKPRVYKWDRTMGAIAGDLVTFVDDVRATAKTVELAWAIARQVCSRVQFLGIQDAARKRKPPTQTPGAWAGAVFATTEDTVTKTVTIEKWKKAKLIVETLNAKIRNGGAGAKLGYKELEVSRGFLCHLSMTYEVLVPFLKGFHLALAGHLSQRDKDGWKLTDKAWAAYLSDKVDAFEHDDIYPEGVNNTWDADSARLNPPLFVEVSQHLKNDLQALSSFMEQEAPPIVNDRCSSIKIVRYGFGDASGTGFGSTIETRSGLKYRVGVWGSDEESESSNFKELENVVTTIEDEATSGGLADSALYFFTDNTTVEAALFKGNSRSKKLFQLVVRFRKIQLLYGMQVTVSHVSGKRMIVQGTDGFSRGNMKEGVGSGIEMTQFIPLHQSATERHWPLTEWIRSWAGNEVEHLNPCDWFTRGHDHFGGRVDTSGFWRVSTKPGIFLWSPPPAAAEASIEQLRRALIKRQRSTHIVIIPRLLTTEWLKQLHKAADLLVYLPAGVDDEAWPSHMFEPLTIAFIFPFLSCEPWKRKGTPKMCDVARKLSRLWKEDKVDSRSVLRKFFETQLQLSGMSQRLVRKMLFFK